MLRRSRLLSASLSLVCVYALLMLGVTPALASSASQSKLGTSSSTTSGSSIVITGITRGAPRVGGDHRGQGQSPSPKVIIGEDPCLYFAMWAKSSDSNNVIWTGNLTNLCSSSPVHSGFLSITPHIDCAGNTNGADVPAGVDLPDPWDYNVTIRFTATATYFCEVCTDGVATAWPPFSGGASASAVGIETDGNTAYGNQNTLWRQLPNSPQYTIPC